MSENDTFPKLYYPSYKSNKKIISDKLGYTQLTRASKYFYNAVDIISTCGAIEEFFKTHGFTVLEVFNYEDSRIAPLEYNIFTDGRITFDYVINGCFLVERHGIKFVFELSTNVEIDHCFIYIYGSEQQRLTVVELLQAITAYSISLSKLRGAKIEPSCEPVVVPNTYTWDSIVLPSDIKEDIKCSIDSIVQNLHIYQANKLAVKRGLILSGTPGQGKTLLLKILCNTYKDFTFLWATPKYLGSPGAASGVVRAARKLAPTILCLEDIDMYGGDREDPTQSNAILGELMNQLDGVVDNNFIITIATTNRVDYIENALRNRPGRFDKVIHIPEPNLVGREELLRLYTKMCECDIDYGQIAELSKGYSGSHIKFLVDTAIELAIKEKSLHGTRIILSTNHFVKAIPHMSLRVEKSLGFGKE